MSRAAMLSLAFVLGSGLCLQGQDLWDASFKLVGGTMSGAEKAGLGQDKHYGLSLEGAYPFARNHFLVLEGGYRAFPCARTYVDVQTATEDSMDGFFGAIAYRYRFSAGRLDGLYLQGGVRHSMFLAERDTVHKGASASGGDLRVGTKGSQIASTRPVFGVGFRFTESVSLELDLAGIQAENALGQSKSGSVIELALGIHL